MKYRQCKSIDELSLSPDTIPSRDESKWATKTYQVEVITPIYGGGVKAGEPDKNMPIRASSIRGQLRYWWRFLAMNREDKPRQGEELFKEERRIWGGMTDNPDEDGSSKVFVRIHNLEYTTQNNQIETITANELIGRKPGIGYALFSAIQGDDNHQLIQPTLTFKLHISIHHDLNDSDINQIKSSIDWWLNFGGIGARTRRGLGSVYSKDAKLLSAEDVNKYGCRLEEINATNDKNAIDAWNKAVGVLQHFRQIEFIYNRNSDHEVKGIGRRIKKSQKINDTQPKTYPSRSNWPEPDSIREIVRSNSNGHEPIHPAKISFPRATFGLPIIFDFVQDSPPEKTELIPVLDNTDSNNARMASPLILKAFKIDNTFKAIALKMPDSHLDTLVVRLKNSKNSKNNHLPKDFTAQGNDSWWDSDKAKHVKPINDNKGDNNATNALDAFMNFFAKGGK